MLELKLKLEEEETSRQKSDILSEEFNHLCLKARNKEIFSIDEQIDYARHKGISIAESEETIVRDILSNRTYYFKVTAYRKNFEKDANGKYVNLSFIQLNDLAKIDMYLRMTLSRMIFELEHSLKTLLVNLITNSLDEDGYSIVKEYDSYMQKKFVLLQRKKGNISNEEEVLFGYVQASHKIIDKIKGKFGYDFDFYSRHHHNISIWVLLEIMTLGNLQRFIEFYFEKKYFGYQKLKTANQLLKYVTNVRNAAAHSRPLIYNIVEPFQYGKKNQIKNKRASIQLTQFAEKSGVDSELSNRVLTNRKMNDIVTTLYLHDKYVTTAKLKQKASKDLQELVKRIRANREIYRKNDDLLETFKFFKKIVTRYSELNA
ncbi:Abi family protein [Enterococcus mundtii]|uniref:Abi family protein n=1 Tax=Enterococcus mundtii TaxID=53346 RepID=UPI00149598F6|nr:Abi family protein [Enterococcus mundtii]